MRYATRTLALILALATMFLCLAPALADFGDFDTGGDYGGGDYGGGGWDSDSGSRGGGGSGILGILMLPFIILMAIYQGIKTLTAKIRYKLTMRGMNAMKQADPDFSWEDMEAWIRSLYAHMQADWERGDINDLQSEFESACWRHFNTQLSRKKADGYTGHVRGITFREIKLMGWRNEGDTCYMDIRLRTNIVSWNTDSSGRISTGSQTEPKDMEYLWRLQRPANARTSASPVACPACQSSNLRLMAHCAKCGAPLPRDNDQWKLYDIAGIPKKK